MDRSIFVYGSLMHPDELASLFGDVSSIRCKLSGYIRDFSKIAHSWGGDETVGVLGLLPCESGTCNGLLVTGLTDEQVSQYYERETGMRYAEYDEQQSGYRIVSVPIDQFEFVYGDTCPAVSSVLTAVINDRLSEPNPHPEYRNLCYEAAGMYGDQFQQDFEKTTYTFYTDYTEK